MAAKPMFQSVVLAAACLMATHVTAADDLEKQLLKNSKPILEEVRAKGYRNVGVIKFRIKSGDGPATDRLGTMNLRLAEKLELALILANKLSDPIGIIRNANATAATIPDASHLTPEGRAKLFSKNYPLAWGKTRVVPDAFLTGAAAITSDLRTMTVVVMAFDSKKLELEQLARFDVQLDLEDLLESGESFTVRGVFDNASLKLTEEERKDKATTEARETSVTTKTETETAKTPTESKLHPLSPQNAESPVALEIRYNGKPQVIEFRGGAAFVAEPAENQKVSFVIRRKANVDQRLGIVLKVNGENTLYGQKTADPQCSSWIMGPERKEIRIDGYQTDEKSLKPFRVLSQADSKAKEIDYGEFVGSISISVFREQTVAPKPAADLALTDEGEDFNILKKGTQPETTPSNPGALRQQLAQTTTRGLIVDGVAVDRAISTSTFEKDTIPIMSASVKYYNPQDLPE